MTGNQWSKAARTKLCLQLKYRLDSLKHQIHVYRITILVRHMNLFLLFLFVNFCAIIFFLCRFFDCAFLCCGREKNELPGLSIPPAQESSAIVDDSFRLIAFGDWGEMDSVNDLQRIGAYIQSPLSTRQAVLLLGDNIYPSGASHEVGIGDPKFELFSKHLAGTGNMSTQYFVVAGNHDHMGDLRAQFRYHDKDPRWNMVHEVELKLFQLASGKYMCIWMFDGLAIRRVVPKLRLSLELEKRRCHWRILASHYPIYTEGGYKRDILTLQIRHFLQPLLESYRVHLYLSAHEHSSQVLIGRRSRTVHLIAGASVGVRYDLSRDGQRGSDGLYDLVWANDRMYPVILQLHASERVLTFQFVHLPASAPEHPAEGSIPPFTILYSNSIANTGP